MGVIKNPYKILVVEPAENRPFVIFKRKWKNDIKMYHKKY
jgi:hypothetical protein